MVRGFCRRVQRPHPSTNHRRPERLSHAPRQCQSLLLSSIARASSTWKHDACHDRSYTRWSIWGTLLICRLERHAARLRSGPITVERYCLASDLSLRNFYVGDSCSFTFFTVGKTSQNPSVYCRTSTVDFASRCHRRYTSNGPRRWSTTQRPRPHRSECWCRIIDHSFPSPRRRAIRQLLRGGRRYAPGHIGRLADAGWKWREGVHVDQRCAYSVHTEYKTAQHSIRTSISAYY